MLLVAFFFLLLVFFLCVLLVFVSLISVCLGMFLLGFILYGILCASWTWLTISFSMLGKFSTIISLKIFSYPFFFSPSSSSAAAAKSLQLCPTLCDPIDGSQPGSPIPGIFQAKVLEWVAISFSNAWKWKVRVKSLSCVRLLASPWTAAYQAPLPMGFSRQEYSSGVPLPSLGPLSFDCWCIWYGPRGLWDSELFSFFLLNSAFQKLFPPFYLPAHWLVLLFQIFCYWVF